MNKRQKKKQAYKSYIRNIFEGYEDMIQHPDQEKRVFNYRNEETTIYRDENGRIRFLTKDN